MLALGADEVLQPHEVVWACTDSSRSRTGTDLVRIILIGRPVTSGVGQSVAGLGCWWLLRPLTSLADLVPGRRRGRTQIPSAFVSWPEQPSTLTTCCEPLSKDSRALPNPASPCTPAPRRARRRGRPNDRARRVRAPARPRETRSSRSHPSSRAARPGAVEASTKHPPNRRPALQPVLTPGLLQRACFTASAGLAITDDAHRSALRSTRIRLRRAMRQRCIRLRSHWCRSKK
jgi:hypothetical protein